MSWFSSRSESSAPVQNFYPVTSSLSGYGKLTDKDTEWTCASNRGFQTETQIWYSLLADGSFTITQVIWSYTGIFLIPATAQFTFKHYNPKTKEITWKSINASNFKANGRACKSDELEIRHTGNAAGEEVYTVVGSLDKKVQLSLTFTKPASAPGFKYGDGPDGGFSTFGKDREDGKRDGIVIHRFHPLVKSTGSAILDGKVVDFTGEAMFVAAIQGMRPDNVASKWNFAFFTTGVGAADSKLGDVRAVQMELETTDAYGPKGANSGRSKVNIGAVYTSNNQSPLTVVGETSHSDPSAYPKSGSSSELSTAKHLTSAKDDQTGYVVPTSIEFEWKGPRVDGKGQAGAKVNVGKLGVQVFDGGLIEKVDVLAEIPFVIKKALAAVTGTKPYVYQYLNPATLEVTLDEEKTSVQGFLFNEASFVSN